VLGIGWTGRRGFPRVTASILPEGIHSTTLNGSPASFRLISS